MRDGIADIHHLGLSAMEIQFIKVNPLSRIAMDEEIGKSPRELVQQLVVAVGGTAESPAEPTVAAMTQPVKRRAFLTTITSTVAKDYADLQQTKALARALDVDLTLHAPYYVDFFGSGEARERSKRQIQWASVLAEGLGARMVVTHLGFYGPGPRADSVQSITEIVGDLSRWLAQYSKGEIRLGIVPSGHPDVFGSRDEVLGLVHAVKGTVPILNLPHVAARDALVFDTPESIEPLAREFRQSSGGKLYLNFSGVEIYRAGEFRLTPIKRGSLKFDPLADLLVDRDYDATVISSSPLLEHDAMYMKVLYERALTRRWTKRHGATSGGAAAKPAPVPPRPPLLARPPPKPAPPRPRAARPPPRARSRHRPTPKRRAHGRRRR